MPKIATPLTDTQIRNAKPATKEYTLAHGNGMYLRIRTNGTKEWIMRYKKPYLGTRTAIQLGKYPALSLKEAQNIRDKYLGLLETNIDPLESRSTNNQNNASELQRTLILVSTQWFEVKKTHITPDYADDIWRSLEKHIFPMLGSKPISKINAPETIETIKPLAAKGSLETVKRLCQRLNEIMTFAVNSGFIHSNPLSGIKNAFAKPQKRHNPTLEPTELPLLMLHLSKASISNITRALIEWQLHTMTRPNEAATAQWDEICFDKSIWTIPANKMKKRREHIIPLSTQAIDILRFMEPISGNGPYIFPSSKNPRKHANEQTPNVALKRMGFKDRLTAHGMRALASTTLNEKSFRHDVIESALAHVDPNETRRSYNHAKYLQERREMMNWWSQQIEEASKGSINLTYGRDDQNGK